MNRFLNARRPMMVEEMPSRAECSSAAASSISGPGWPGCSGSGSGSGAAGVSWRIDSGMSCARSSSPGGVVAPVIGGLLAAGQRGQQVAGGEGDAERGQRLAADQVLGIAEHLAALVDQRLHLVVQFQPRLAGGGSAGVDRFGDPGLERFLRVAEVFLGRVDV